MSEEKDHVKSKTKRKELTPEQDRVTQQRGTEAPFSGKYYAHKDSGMYLCTVCGEQLFASGTKYESGTGWPSFWAPATRQRWRPRATRATVWFARKCTARIAARI